MTYQYTPIKMHKINKAQNMKDYTVSFYLYLFNKLGNYVLYVL